MPNDNSFQEFFEKCIPPKHIGAKTSCRAQIPTKTSAKLAQRDLQLAVFQDGGYVRK